MISLRALAELAQEYAVDLDAPVKPVRIGDRIVDTDTDPVVMGTVNLSRDSTYRESVAPTVESAVRKALVQSAQGADCVDIGAESSTSAAQRVGPQEQIGILVPVVETLAGQGVAISVESYWPEAIEAALRAGACMVNLTGAEHERTVFDLVAEYDATLVLCLSPKANVRETADAHTHDPIPAMAEHFARRLEAAAGAGVEQVAIDPGLGFYYANLVDPVVRVRYQSAVLLNSFRLRSLGVPVAHALPHAFDLFEDEFRTAEGFFAVLASLGGTGLFRTHEVPRVCAVLDALRGLTI